MCWYVYKNDFVTNNYYCWNCSEIFQLLTMLSCIYFSSLVPKCLTSGIVTQIFPLHDREKLKALEHKWYLSFNRKQPLGNLNSSIWSIFGLAKHFFWIAIILVFFFPTDSIKDYFGETIALYFGFLSFYSVSLVPPVLLVVVFALSGAHQQTKNTVFAILNLIWGTVFLEAWKRRCAEISFKWGTLTSGMSEDIFSQLTVQLIIISYFFLWSDMWNVSYICWSPDFFRLLYAIA